MSKVASLTTAAVPEKIDAIKLTKPHTHRGRDYQPDDVIQCVRAKLSQRDAHWLIERERAVATRIPTEE